ncbi:amidohydrolase family protein [uncultured Microbulbifer sp.]|uniref:amidohydrolase family protein n=1 Tax=uncultured Microbulbifer sp. TaxID=348147 RepID=UPI0025E0C9E6|nr:amidohydrolase family protein [uncultured Microbulbifer sp.]
MKKYIIYVSSIFLFIPLSLFAQSSEERLPIIDMHLHAHPLGDMPAREPLTGLLAPETTEQVKLDSIAALKKNNIVLAVTSGTKVHEYAALAPDRIIKGCSFFGMEKIAEIRQLIKEKKCEILSESGPQYAGFAPDNPKLDPYFSLAEELDVPIGLHMGLGPPGAAYMGMTKYRMSNSNPLLLEDVLIKHPKLRLYVAHAGWPMLDEMIGLLYAHPQVYVDISVIDWVLPQKEFYHYLKRMVNAGFGKRIMYGSDQMIWPDSIEKSIAAITEAPFLSESEKRDILYNNAARFLRLDDKIVQ